VRDKSLAEKPRNGGEETVLVAVELNGVVMRVRRHRIHALRIAEVL
jgi:hypothetical protein